MDKLVSIVIPTHNRVELLSRAVKSALNQTYTNIEINVVSDGSTDGTDNVMEDFCAADSRVHFYSYYPAKGGNHARNVGIENSKGEYIAFLDDDDEWHADKINKQLKVFDSDSRIGLVCTGINSVHPKEGYSVPFIPKPKFDSESDILLGNSIGSTTTVMVKKELFMTTGMFDEKLGALQDYDMWIRLCQITKIGVVSHPCVEYYNYDNSNQISGHTDKYEKAVQYLDEKYALLISKLSIEEQRQRKLNFSIVLAKKAMRNGDSHKSRQYIKEAAKTKFTGYILVCYVATFFSKDFANKVSAFFRKIKYKG